MITPDRKTAPGKPLHRAAASRWIRTAVQIFFFVLVALVTAGKALNEAGIALPFTADVSLHAICPFGGVVSIYNLATVGTFVQKIHDSAFVLMMVVLVLSVLFGPVFCGWVCPFGSVQEWIGKLGKKLLGKRYNNLIPAKADKVMRFLRYGVLALVIYVTATSAKLLFQNVDPYYALFNFYTGEVTVIAFVVLGVTAMLSLIVERPWCKYACPYGALLGIFNLFRVFGIRRKAPTCVNCKACDKACPMNIKVSTAGTVRDHQCITCMKCTSENTCPVKDTVNLSLPGKKGDTK